MRRFVEFAVIVDVLNLWQKNTAGLTVMPFFNGCCRVCSTRVLCCWTNSLHSLPANIRPCHSV